MYRIKADSTNMDSSSAPSTPTPSPQSGSSGTGVSPHAYSKSFVLLGRLKLNTFAVLQNLKIESLIAGVTGGVLSTLVLHPLDLLKIRFAVNDGKVSVPRPQYQNLREAIRMIYSQEGLKGFYRGATPNLLGAGLSWGFYFLFYNCIKDYMVRDRGALTPWLHLIAAGQAGILTLSLTNPFWVIKTRLCLQYGDTRQLLSSNVPSYKVYNGVRDAFYKIYKYEGMRGMYRGVVPGIFGVCHGSLQFMIYEELKKQVNKRKNAHVDDKLDNFEYISCAAVSKLIAASVTYPYQVVRARLQDQYTEFSGVIDVIEKTWRSEGLRGFYRGFPAYVIHVTPNIIIVFACYEFMTHQ